MTISRLAIKCEDELPRPIRQSDQLREVLNLLAQAGELAQTASALKEREPLPEEALLQLAQILKSVAMVTATTRHRLEDVVELATTLS